MALSGLEIFKKLPKTNCKECNFPTCLAFAMQVAAGKVEIGQCPHVSEEIKAELSESAAPPIRGITIGAGDGALKIGEETVMFRHDKRFEHQPGFALLITDQMSEEEVNKKIAQFNSTKFERVGITMKAELIAIKSVSGDLTKFESLINKVKGQTQGLLVLMSDSVEVLKVAVAGCKECKPLLYAATKDNVEQMAQIAKENACPLAVKANNLDELAELTVKLTGAGVKDLVIDSGARTIKKCLEDHIMLRRLALKKAFRPLGFPTITFPCEMTKDTMEEALIASMFVAKYAGIIVLSDLDPARLYPLFTLRMNIYTDPQRPMMMEEKIYEINSPTQDSPVLITTNFSLTYFIVSGEIEASKTPTWLCVMNTEGLSVLTAWSAGKFVADAIAPFIKKCGIAEKVNHRNLVIPGYVAQISGELEEELGGDWKVTVGVREASDLPVFLQRFKKG
ncbi:MAG: acetyl-CoA decarbonylase/synthase complex subunit gamma [Nitrospirota bacterium]